MDQRAAEFRPAAEFQPACSWLGDRWVGDGNQSRKIAPFGNNDRGDRAFYLSNSR